MDTDDVPGALAHITCGYNVPGNPEDFREYISQPFSVQDFISDVFDLGLIILWKYWDYYPIRIYSPNGK